MAVTAHQPHRVFLKAKWADEWEYQSDDGLYCDWCKHACSPDVNEAQLSRTFGPNILRAGAIVPVHANPLDIEGQYVKVEIALDAAGFFTQVATWIGVVIKTVENRWGRVGLNGEIGRQIFECRGLEYLLQRSIVDSSFIEVPEASQEEEDTREIGRGIGFNLGGGQPDQSRRIGNRSDEIVDATYVFADSLGDEPYTDEDAKLWTGEQIAEYLINKHRPKDRIDTEVLPFLLDHTTSDALASFKPTLHTHGKSVKDLLDELIDRRRLVTWWLELEHDDELDSDFLYVKVATFNKDNLVLPSSAILSANPNQANWYQDDEGLIVSFETVKDDSSHFHQVIARGEPLGVCFTITEEEDNLAKDWSDDLQTAYRTAATLAPDYGALDEWARMNANQSYRNTDKFLKVYRYFIVPPIWDGQASNREVFKDPEADPEDGLPVWLPGLRFKNMLPLLTEVDYADVEAITSESLEGSKPEYRRPFAVVYDIDADRYYHLDKMSYGESWDDDLKTNGRSWSAHLRMQDDAFGVIIDVSGAPQHVIAGTDFTPIDEADTDDQLEALDWRKISCTVFCEFDGFAEAKHPVTITDDDDVIKKVYIHVPNARLDYLAPETIIGIDNEGALQRCTSGGYVRDDREKLEDIARSSYEWYSIPRRSVNATIRSLISNIELGDMVLNVGSVNTQVVSNSVVTMIRYDLIANTTTIQTQFAQLDLTAF
jgi:hypothetical protein